MGMQVLPVPHRLAHRRVRAAVHAGHRHEEQLLVGHVLEAGRVKVGLGVLRSVRQPR